MKSRGCFCLFFFLTFFLSFKVSSAESNSYSVHLEARNESIRVTFELNQFKRNELRFGSKTYESIEMASASFLDQKAYPQLPKINRDILLPLSAIKTKIQIIDLQSKRWKSLMPLPSRGAIMRNQDPDQIPFEESKIYNSKAVFPQQIIKMGALSQIRDFKVVNLELRPFRYDFKTRELEVFEKITFDLLFESAAESRQWLQKSMDLSFFKFYQQQFQNFPAEEFNQRTESLTMSLHPGKMLILSAQKFEGMLDEFVEWKNTRGLETFVLYLPESRTSWNDIKTYVKDFYLNEKISHVLLVGDSDLVPFHPGLSGNAKNNEADPLYGLLEGDDYYPEVFVARFAIKTDDELRRVIRKSIDYEKHPHADAQWYSEALGIASNEGSWSGTIDYERLNLLADMLLNWDYKNFTKVYDPNAKGSAVKEALENGVGFINYIGHGWEKGWVSSGFRNRDVLDLKNSEKWPFIVSVACVNGRFAYKYGDSFAEAWLKGAEGENPTGALAIFASSTNQSWVPPTVGQKKITELLTAELESSLGGLFFAGSVAVIEDSSSTAEQTYETWHIFGDSSIQVRSRAPEEIQVEFASLKRLANSQWAIELATNTPLASISLMTADGVVLRGVTDSNGQFNRRFMSSSLRSNERLALSLTGFNRFPEFLELTAN